MRCEKKIGIVILNYNDYKTTKKLIDNVAVMSAFDEIVVVDNFSSDESYEKLKLAYGNMVNVIRTEYNGGYSYGNNFGAKILLDKSCDIIFFSNPDVFFTESFVTTLVQDLCEYNYSAVSGKMYTEDGNENELCTKINSYFDDILDCTLIMKRIIPHKEKTKREGFFLITQFLEGSLFAVESNCFKEIGMFDENIFLYCEERIIGKKLEKLGKKLAIDERVYYYHFHSVSVNKSISEINKIKALYKSRLYYYERYTNKTKLAIWCLKLAMGYGIVMRTLCRIVTDVIK